MFRFPIHRIIAIALKRDKSGSQNLPWPHLSYLNSATPLFWPRRLLSDGNTVNIASAICFGVELALCDFFSAPTIQNLAELIEEEILAKADSNQIDELLDLLEKIEGESAQTVRLTE